MTSVLHRRGPGGKKWWWVVFQAEQEGTGKGIGKMLRYISRVKYAACSVADQESKQTGSRAFHPACTTPALRIGASMNCMRIAIPALHAAS